MTKDSEELRLRLMVAGKGDLTLGCKIDEMRKQIKELEDEELNRFKTEDF